MCWGVAPPGPRHDSGVPYDVFAVDERRWLQVRPPARPLPSPLPAQRPQISLGLYHACGVLEDGSAECFVTYDQST